MASELSLRHLPDISDASAMPDFSDSSFQIPLGTGSSNDLLLEEDSMDFLRDADDTLSTPAPPNNPRTRQPLTLAELTPRAKTTRTAAVRSSLRPRSRPIIATPRRTAVAIDLSAALEETISPPHGQETSFTTPVEEKQGQPSTCDKAIGSGSAHIISDSSLLSKEQQQLIPRLNRLPSTEPQPLGPMSTKNAHPKSNPNGVGSYIQEPHEPNIKAPIRHLQDDPITIPEVEKAAVPASSAKPQGLLRGERTKRKKPAVIGGGITKQGKAKVPRATVSRLLSSLKGDSERPPMDDSTRPPAKGTVDNGDKTNQSSTIIAHHTGDSYPPSGGLASALISYGQKSTQHTSPSTSHSSNSPDTNVDHAASTAISSADAAPDAHEALGKSSRNVPVGPHRDSDRDSPLTLSQLSPLKEAPTPPDARRLQTDTAGSADEIRPQCPAHPSVKRPQSAVSTTSYATQHKRSKTAPLAPAKEVPNQANSKTRGRAPLHARVKTLDGPTPQPASESHSRHGPADPHAKEVRSRPDSSTSSSRSATNTNADGKEKGGTKRQLTHTRGASASSRSISRSGDLRDSQKENVPDGRGRRLELPGDGHMHRPGQMPGLGKQTQALPPAKPTRPIEFHFQSDARVEARKAELEKSGSLRTRSRSHAPLPIPDFKAMHAAHESALAARKEQIVPVVPMEIELSTDIRAREREKFEEARRAREREIEQQMEERRRQRELEEEREIKELRKRAVPKANEVPEWYADAPKRTAKTKS